MTRRIIGSTLVLCAAAVLTAWGLEHARSAFNGNVIKDEDQQKTPDDAAKAVKQEATDERPLVPVPEPRHSVPELPARHATDAEDAASIHAIRAQSAAMFAEYNAKHAQAYAERFLPNAEYEMDTGDVISGRAAIQEHFEKLFQEFPQGHAHSHESNIRTISLHMAIEDGVIAVSHAADDEELEAPYLAIWTFADGRWFLASMRELTSDQAGKSSAHEQLQELAWLVGDWVDETHESVVRTSCRWSEDGNFLIQDFTVHILGTHAVSGTQRIGYDPLTHKLRSWVFDSHGGFGESNWNWDGEKWVIRSSAVRHNGTTAASLNFLIPQTQDSYLWESSHRMVDNENLPDLQVQVVRQAPPPETDPTEHATQVGRDAATETDENSTTSNK